MKKVIITKGELKGVECFAASSKKEEIGSGILYSLIDANNEKVWNGQFTYFPESFIQFI